MKKDNNKRIAVTGAGGYIGCYVVKQLLDMGYIVCAIDKNIKNIDARAEKLQLDLFLDYKNIFEELGSPDICLHMAWQDGFVHNSEKHLASLYNHYLFIKKMVDNGLKHVAVMGSMHEVGYFEGAIDENTPTNPTSLYGIAKNSLRQSLEALFNDTNIIFQWLRCYYICGDDLKNQSIFTKIIKMEAEGQETFPFTIGENKYDFIDIKNVALQISLAITQTGIKDIINCCSGTPISLKDQVEMFLKENNFKIRPEYGVYPTRPYDSPAVWGNDEKIQKILKGINHAI